MSQEQNKPQIPQDEATSTAPLELRAVRVAIVCSIIGASTKLIVGLITGSMSMVSSAVDSLGDLLVSVVNFFVIRISDTPPDDEHNYGHTKIEGLGAMFEGGFIFAAGVFILYESGHKIVIREESHDATLGIYVMLPLLVITYMTVLYLKKIAAQTGSLVIKSDALHYMTDVWVNLGVLCSLLLVKLTNMPLIDPIISMGIALYMLYSSIHIVSEGFHLVMDKSLDREQVEKVKMILQTHTSIESFHDLKTRAGKIPHVDFHIVVHPEMTTKQVHDLFLQLQQEIREAIGASTKVLMHVDPLGG